MYQLTGEYECSIDPKGRLRIPSALLRQFGGPSALSLVVNRGFEKHLMLYPRDVWNRKVAEVNQLNIYNTDERKFMRYFYRGASELELDNADRVLIPKSLMDYAQIDKEVILFAYHEQIEMWSKEAYNQITSVEPDDFSALAEAVFGHRRNERI